MLSKIKIQQKREQRELNRKNKRKLRFREYAEAAQREAEARPVPRLDVKRIQGKQVFTVKEEKKPWYQEAWKWLKDNF